MTLTTVHNVKCSPGDIQLKYTCRPWHVATFRAYSAPKDWIEIHKELIRQFVTTQKWKAESDAKMRMSHGTYNTNTQHTASCTRVLFVLEYIFSRNSITKYGIPRLVIHATVRLNIHSDNQGTDRLTWGDLWIILCQIRHSWSYWYARNQRSRPGAVIHAYKWLELCFDLESRLIYCHSHKMKCCFWCLSQLKLELGCWKCVYIIAYILLHAVSLNMIKYKGNIVT